MGGTQFVNIATNSNGDLMQDVSISAGDYVLSFDMRAANTTFSSFQVRVRADGDIGLAIPNTTDVVQKYFLVTFTEPVDF